MRKTHPGSVHSLGMYGPCFLLASLAVTNGLSAASSTRKPNTNVVSLSGVSSNITWRNLCLSFFRGVGRLPGGYLVEQSLTAGDVAGCFDGVYLSRRFRRDRVRSRREDFRQEGVSLAVADGRL
jgi:hypothetical protein